MKIIVDRDKCVGSGQCVMTAEGVFDQSEEDGIVELLDPEPPAEAAADVRLAASLCPAMAIRIEDAAQ
ncbi:ferredoxin [Actinomadura sp. NBRC 104425]|uniref:ferredoxin n=1 Tax=Actinomadura sp. NBRC 104425 TaxID=3032204 RepID=UPI0024A18E72|nr:ferredoxin [Actinomadura sp. NBRC 104425]GLZ12956.1 ferredoxin [Actinomadura sp. NBRC 104425]